MIAYVTGDYSFKYKDCWHCGKIIYITSGTTETGSGNCPKCGHLAWAKTSCSNKKESSPKRGKRCSVCGGSGYDRMGKPCRKC